MSCPNAPVVRLLLPHRDPTGSKHRQGKIPSQPEDLRIAVCRVFEDEELASKVARDFGFCRHYLYSWLRKFKDEGRDALCE